MRQGERRSAAKVGARGEFIEGRKSNWVFLTRKWNRNMGRAGKGRIDFGPCPLKLLIGTFRTPAG